jgi:hypothetical protein
MDKSTLNKVVELVSYNSVPKADKDESFEAFVKRSFETFTEKISKNKNPVIIEAVKDMSDPLKNAVAMVAVRTAIVENFCRVNDSFELEPPKDATVDEVLKNNGVEASEKQMRQIMGDEPFEKYLKSLKKPKSDGLSKREIEKERILHNAKYEPCYPSEKSFEHGSGGTTRGFHWEGALQPAYIEDQKSFIEAYNLQEPFVVYPDDKDSEKSDSEKSDSEKSGS